MLDLVSLFGLCNDIANVDCAFLSANSYIFGPDYKDIKEIRNYDFEIEEKIHIYGKDLVIKLSPSKNNWLFDK